MTVVRRSSQAVRDARVLALEGSRKDALAEAGMSDAIRALIDVFAPLLTAADPTAYPNELAVRQKVKQRIKARLT